MLNHTDCHLRTRHLLKRCKHLKEILHRRLRHAELNRWHLKLAALRRGVVRHLYPDHIWCIGSFDVSISILRSLISEIVTTLHSLSLPLTTTHSFNRWPWLTLPSLICLHLWWYFWSLLTYRPSPLFPPLIQRLISRSAIQVSLLTLFQSITKSGWSARTRIIMLVLFFWKLPDFLWAKIACFLELMEVLSVFIEILWGRVLFEIDFSLRNNFLESCWFVIKVLLLRWRRIERAPRNNLADLYLILILIWSVLSAVYAMLSSLKDSR